MAITLVEQSQNAWLGGSGSWHEPSNWSLGHIPARCEDVFITNAGTVITVTITSGSIVEVHSVWAIGDVELQVGDGAILSVEME